MRILIIGGTMFVGRALTVAALAAGHDVSLFNRGNTNPDLFPQVEKLRGDRLTPEGISALDGKTWDAVIDTSAYIPRAVNIAVDKLKDATDHYVFISTISVYDIEQAETPITEDAPLLSLADETTEEVTGETYGGLKVLCERTAERAFGDRLLTIRPGLIYGPHDSTDRFTYWPVRVARGGRMIAPPRESILQVIDARDLAEWTMRMVEAQTIGIYNAVGLESAVTFGEVIDASVKAAGAQAATPVYAEEAFLTKHTQIFADLPLWLPKAADSIMQTSNQRAVGAGLTFRSLTETVVDTLAWFVAERGLTDDLSTGLKAEREAELLAIM